MEKTFNVNGKKIDARVTAACADCSSCIELGQSNKGLLVVETTGGTAIRVTKGEITAFVANAKAGKFDRFISELEEKGA